MEQSVALTNYQEKRRQELKTTRDPEIYEELPKPSDPIDIPERKKCLVHGITYDPFIHSLYQTPWYNC